MIFNQFCVLAIFFGIFCNIQFMTCSWFRETSTQKPKPELKTFDDTEELKVALKLDTGFSYDNYPKILEMNLGQLKGMIFKEELLGHNLFTRPQIMYNDLYCGDLFNLIEHTSLLQSLIVSNSIYEKDEFDNLLLNESIIQQMLAVIIKLDLREFLQPLWNFYMFAIYIKNLKMVNNLLVISHVKTVLNCIMDCFSRYKYQFCRKNNKYNLIPNFDKLKEKEKISMIEDVKKLMVNRNNINKILLHGEEVENWVSLKKIYFHEIIQNKNILETIIKDFGEQSQDSYNVIIKDINDAYDAARNYYWFDVWISNIKVYHDKIFNIFRVVTLHLIRKHVMYLINKDRQIVSECNKQMWNFFQNNYYLFHCMLFPKLTNLSNFQYFSKLFLNAPSNLTETYDDINFIILCDIQSNIQNEFFVESFETIKIKVDDEIYNTNSINKTKTLMKVVKISKEKKEEIKNFKKISDIKGLNDNFERFNIFLEYFMKIFIDKHKFEVFQSFMKFNPDSKIMKGRKLQDLKDERFLDL